MGEFIDRVEILQNLFELNKMKNKINASSQVKHLYAQTISSLWQEFHSKTTIALLEKDLKTLKHLEIECQRTSQFNKINAIQIQVNLNKVLLKKLILNKKVIKANKFLALKNHSLLKFTIVEQNFSLAEWFSDFDWIKEATVQFLSFNVLVTLNKDISFTVDRASNLVSRIRLQVDENTYLLDKVEAMSFMIEKNIKASELITLSSKMRGIINVEYHSINHTLLMKTINYDRVEFLRAKTILEH